MKAVYKELFRAIYQNCWLAVEYNNQKNETTNYWIAVKDINLRTKRLLCEGMHLTTYSIAELNLYLEKIVSAKALVNTYTELPSKLKEDISANPEKYVSIFSETANLRILNYLAECFRLDQSPFKTDFVLVEKIDDESFGTEGVTLSERQFDQIVKGFLKDTKDEPHKRLSMKQFGMNLLSVHTSKGVYLLAYLPLRLHVRERRLGCFDAPVICSQYTINGKVQSVRSFMTPEDLPLLQNFAQNAEEIRNAICYN